ncbi:Ribonuclease H [Phytophthora cinnamomi]|uniref:Ribonuclease H n=1 Tax=Phytophthora cinnamomi TaxID=4785 RepID=UPI003559AC24|nr:Ribonuclease H [Phytophthora cinnamomi]
MSSDEYEPWYYAVANGYKLGVFTDLDDALNSTYGYSYSNWQKFSTFEDAEEFLHANGVIVKRLAQRHNGELTWTAYDVLDPNVKAFVAFCDGSALRNGSEDCTAAYAALFPHNQAWNEVKVLQDTYATSNRAEYSAALAVMKRAARVDPDRSRPVIIFTDSELLVNTMEKFLNKWLRDPARG